MFNDEELTEGERAAFAGLSRERAPSDLLEERVVRELKEREFFRARIARGGRPVRVAIRAAAAVVLFVGGAAADRLIFDRAASGPSQTTSAKVTSEPLGAPQMEQWI
jgi:hypothetical protein